MIEIEVEIENAILRKPLSQAPKRLLDIMMRYHRYDVYFAFVKGTDLLIADTRVELTKMIEEMTKMTVLES